MRISDWSSDVCSSDLVPDLEARVAGAEIIFLFIARTVGNMAFAVGSHDVAVGADHRERVVIMRPVLLEIARRDRDLQLGGERLLGDDARMFVGWTLASEKFLILGPVRIKIRSASVCDPDT